MKRHAIPFLTVLIMGLVGGCAFLQKQEDLPPPLPPIEEPKPPFKMKGEYFKTYPWSALPKARKDGNDPDSLVYTFKEGDTMESVAEKEMGARGFAQDLADYNGLSSPSSVAPGDKIVVPHAIIGLKCQLRTKGKKEKKFGQLEAFDTALKKGDNYQMVFESNVSGYLYVFRQSLKDGVTMVYPEKLKKGKRNKNDEPLMRDTGHVTAFEPLEIPRGDKGFLADDKNVGDQVMVFFSLRKIPALDDLKAPEEVKEKKDKKDKKKTVSKIRIEDVKDVMHSVREGSIYIDGSTRLLRISDPNEILGFSLNING